MSKQNKNTAKLLVKQTIKGHKLLIFANCILSSLVSIAYIFLALVSKQLLDIATGATEGKFYLCAIYMAATVAVQLICHTLYSHLQAVVTGKMTLTLRKRIFNSLFEKKLNQVNSYHSGELLNRFISDSDVVVTSACSLIPAVCQTVTKLIAGTAALLILDWRFGGGLVAIGIFIPAAARLLSAKFKKLHIDFQISNGKLKAFFQETVINMPVIKSFASLVPTKRKLSSLLNSNYNIKLKRNNLRILTSCSFYLFFTAGYFLVLIWGAAGIQKNVVTVGSLIAFLQIISQLKAPMQNVSGFLPQYSSMIASAERICELEEINDELLPVNQKMLDAIRDVFDCIKGENLTFAYGDNTVLKNCNFNIERGNIAVITGESGRGKSTLFKLLLGYEDLDFGRLTLGNKYDINASTRALFSYVPQGNMILSGTIRDNLTLCSDKYSEESINNAIRVAVLDEWIASLPDGLNTEIGENGLGVSEGQAQRISIARALLCDTPILLLDEATCSLDSETEHKLLWNLKDLYDKTVILVTHRTIEDEIADVKLHLDNKKFI